MTSHLSSHPHLLLRLPDLLADRINGVIDPSIDKKNQIEISNRELDVEVSPEGDGFPNHYVFQLDGVRYPALLGNSPTIIELNKTFDKKVFYKSGEIGQVLIVCMDNKERDLVKNNLTTIDPDGEALLPSGYTSATLDIVERRFRRTRRGGGPYPPYRIKSIMEHIELPPVATEDSSGQAEFKEYVEEFEDVVDFEDWMVDPDTQQGRRIEITEDTWTTADINHVLFEHSDLLKTQFDIEEEKIREEELEEEERKSRNKSSSIETERLHRKSMSSAGLPEEIEVEGEVEAKLRAVEEEEEAIQEESRKNAIVQQTQQNAVDSDDDGDNLDFETQLRIKASEPMDTDEPPIAGVENNSDSGDDGSSDDADEWLNEI